MAESKRDYYEVLGVSRDADHEALKGTVKELPTRDEIDVPVDEMLIVELYSKN